MISHASQLLTEFIAAERKVLQGKTMPHMPTLGAAYEAIAAHGIDKQFVIPKSLGLSVCSGFIKVGDHQLPNQIDCMLVHGKGERYGLTDSYIYPVEQVLCVLEVKKTLSKPDLLDAMQHLADVKQAASEHLTQLLDQNKFIGDISATRLHFSQISGVKAPDRLEDRLNLPLEQAVLFHTLLMDQFTPATVVLGFDGHRTEQGLRSAFVDIIGDYVGIPGSFGVPGLPSVVLSSEFSLVKTNGLPYLAKYLPGHWAAIASIRGNPIRVLLEILWTKIGHFYGVKMPWNDGLEMENLSPLISAVVMREGDNCGWAYQTQEPSEKALRTRPDAEWSPAIIGAAATDLFDLMVARGGYVDAQNAELDQHFQKTRSCSLDSVVEELLLTSYFMREGRMLRPLHKLTMSVERDDGTTCIAYDKPKFDEWCSKHGVAPYYMSLVFVDGDAGE